MKKNHRENIVIMYDRKKKVNAYTIELMCVVLVVAMTNYHARIRAYNTTMLALSYQYGFKSRSLLGTIYHILNWILPWDIMHYQYVLLFADVVMVLFVGFLVFFNRKLLELCEEKYMKILMIVEMFFTVTTTATFCAESNFLRVDIFMIWMSLIAAYLLLVEKNEWLVIPISALGVMFHQGYVFMYFNIILVLLLYKWYMTRKKKYIVYFVISFVLASSLFLWFEFFSRSNGAMIYDQVAKEATDLSYQGYHPTLLDHEILGIDLSDSEENFARMNRVQLPVFLIATVPYLIILLYILCKCIRDGNTKMEKLKYFILLCGAGTMLPDFLLKVDYGRWIMAVIAYYSVILCALIVLQDKILCQNMDSVLGKIQGKPCYYFLLFAIILFIPFKDVDINLFAQHTAEWLDNQWFHYFTP